MAQTRPLQHQVALVTGAGRGLGRAFAERLAALGCAVGVHGMREHGPAEYGEGASLTETARAIGDDHGVRTCRALADLTQADQVARVVDDVEAGLGPIDILVHNAGGDIAAAGGRPDPNDAVLIKEADVRAVLERNLLSTILVCQQVARGMMARKRGRILTISSIAAFQARAHGVIYATAKAGVVHYTQCLAKQLRPYDVTANSLFTVASTMGLLPVVAVGGSMYPAFTIALAHVVLGERLRVPQRLGVATALAGVALIAAGGA